MAKFVLASIVAIGLSSIGWAILGAALASDRELLAVLDRLACIPERIVTSNLSSTVVVYEVTCKRSGRVLSVLCLDAECRLQTPRREEREEDER